jgi:hypothetical protein
MAYTKTTWTPRQGTNLNKFTKSSETAASVILTNAPDAISQQGTPFSANNMNHIEQGIADAHTDIEGLKATVGMQVTNGNGLSLASGVLAMATASASAAGAMSSADKAKLDGVATGANNYTLPAATASALGGVQVTAGNGLSLASGVLAMAAASASAAGAMSSADKAKLDKTSEVTASSFGSSSGYVKYGNGLIIQWGRFYLSDTSVYTISFPITFSNIPFLITCISRQQSDGTPQGFFGIREIRNASFTGAVVSSTDYVLKSYTNWIAIGA